MWIEARKGKLVNTENVSLISVESFEGKTVIPAGFGTKNFFVFAVSENHRYYLDSYSTEESARLAIKKISFALKKNQKFFTIPTEEELNKRPEKETETVNKKEPCMSIEEAINMWNTLADNGFKQISQIPKGGTQRWQLLRARLIQYTKEDYEKCIDNIRRSELLRKNADGWFNFDWFIRPNNFPKVLDGNYNTAEDRIDTNEKVWWDE